MGMPMVDPETDQVAFDMDSWPPENSIGLMQGKGLATFQLHLQTLHLMLCEANNRSRSSC